METAMFPATVPLWAVLLIVLITIVVTALVTHRMRTRKPETYAEWASRAKDFGAKIESRTESIFDRNKNPDGDG
jgi:uncharacterized protein (DUF983 family)